MKSLKKKILITGANSLVGTGICRVLFERGYDLYGTYNTNKKNFNNKICKLYKINFLNKNFEKKISDIIKYNKIKYIIHNASLIPAKIKNKKKTNDFNKINFQSTKVIIRLIKKFSIKKFILISTLAVLNKNKSLNKIENKYLSSKKKSEDLCIKFNGDTKTAILRIKAPYGFDLNSNSVVHKFIKLSLKDKNLKLINKGERTQNFTFVDDIGKAVHNILFNKKINKINNLNGSRSITMKNLAIKVLKIFNKKTNNKISYIDQKDIIKKNFFIKKNEIRIKNKTLIDQGLKIIYQYLKKS
jgi:nucleoside-diphosphate-sugar epimerase